MSSPVRNSAIPTYVARVLTLSSRSHTPHLALFDGFKGTDGGGGHKEGLDGWIGGVFGGSIDRRRVWFETSTTSDYRVENQ